MFTRVEAAGGAVADPHAGHDHAHSGHSEATSIELSNEGLKNIGFTPVTIGLKTYERTLTLPAIIVERPGRSQVHVTAPLTGIVTTIYAVNGEAIEPGAPLFELRLTHEELVTAQRDYLTSQAKLEIVNREIDRLQGLGEGVVAGKRILEQQYEKQKLEVAIVAEEQAMLLHGLSEKQIEEIGKTQRLFRTLTVRTPEIPEPVDACQGPHLFTVQRLGVSIGEQVEVGQELAILSDHCQLHVEGQAFEDDASQIRNAAAGGKKITARLLKNNTPGAVVEGLDLLYVADQVDADSRALKVFLRLPNQVALDRSGIDGKRVIEWRYKPGQRMQISIPVETWEKQIVLPTSGVVDEGAEAYVYRQNGDHFDQVPVHVLNRDQASVVIANDGVLFPGDVIAGNGAYEMHLALKNKSGGGIDPHAGHNH
ncbi:efflux RND transporter periplasmic adaptor subunit [Aeoliella sp.]|uniref:efflux RND transporter periplasmic adaptor subunit n=1 Tax=Aeoliella sp. TaxID=2795800 RepID=UPI003CCB8429